MKTLSRFVAKFTSSIFAVLSCFDRVIFKGHLALAAPCELEYFVDCVLKVRRSDFMKTIAPQYSDRLVAHARDWAQKAARNYVYRTGQVRKDEWAQNLIRDQGISEGLAGVLCTLETCPSFAIVPGLGRPQFVSRPRQQRVLYYYFLDRQFGLIHVRIQTWLPFTVQVYVIGHEWLAQQMAQKKLGFVQQHNRAHTARHRPRPGSTLSLIKLRAAQLVKDPQIVGHDWSIRCCAMCSPTTRCIGSPTRPSTPPTCCLKVRDGLGRLVPRAPGIRGVHVYSQGHPRLSRPQVGSPLRAARSTPTTKTTRWFGTRIKHRMKTSWLKMYDKFDLILRVETVINSPEGVLGLSHQNGTATALHRWATTR